MTYVEFLTAVSEGRMNEEVIGKALELIEAHQRGLEKAHERAAKAKVDKMAERQPIIDALVGALTDAPQSATDLITNAGVELKPQAVATYFRLYVEPGTFEKVEMKGAKGKIVGYKKA